MKTELLQYIRQNMPEIRYIKTDNDEENNVMRSVNRLSGFESLPINLGFEFDFNELHARFSENP